LGWLGGVPPPSRENREHRVSIPHVRSNERVVHIDPDILGGTPVFVGTRVPLQTLIDYLVGGHPLSDFLDDFPTVTREVAIAVLSS